MNAVTEVMDELRKALAELEDCRARNADLRTMLERVTRERDLALGRLENEIKAANQARMAEERARESLEEIDEAIYDCLPWDDDESPLDCVEHAADRLRELAKERDEARAKYEVLHEEADRALRAPLLALSAIVGGDAFFAPGPWDSQTQGMNALAERITRSFAIWRDRASKQSTEDFKRGAEAMREACAVALMADGLVLSRERAANVVRALPIPEEP